RPDAVTVALGRALFELGGKGFGDLDRLIGGPDDIGRGCGSGNRWNRIALGAATLMNSHCLLRINWGESLARRPDRALQVSLGCRPAGRRGWSQSRPEPERAGPSARSATG